MVNAVKIKRKPKPRTTTFKVLLSAMVPLSCPVYNLRLFELITAADLFGNFHFW